MTRRRFRIRVHSSGGFAIADLTPVDGQPPRWIGRAATLPAAFARIERYLERGW